VLGLTEWSRVVGIDASVSGPYISPRGRMLRFIAQSG
jgi:hypothetical protein